MPSPRVRKTIKLKSPKGSSFTALWKGAKRSGSKRVARWSYAGVNGEVADDYGANSDTYPMVIIFDGKDFDLNSERFAKACKETGKWEVIHPTRGFKGYQLLDYGENDEPVTNANSIAWDTTWMEYIDPEKLKTAAQLKAEAGQALNEFNSELLNRYQNVKVDKFSERSSLLTAAEGIRKNIVEALKPIADKNAEQSASFIENQRGMQEMIAAGIIEPLTLAAQIKETIQEPMLGVKDIKNRLIAARDLAFEIFGIDTGDGGNYNVAATKEVALFSIIGALSIIKTTSFSSADGPKSQSQAVDMVNTMNILDRQIVEHLEAEQEKMNNRLQGDKYVAGGSLIQAKTIMDSSSNDYVLKNILTLKREKKITMKKATSPIQVVADTYGTLGENDQLLYDFVELNGLKGGGLRVIPKGKSVTVYV